MPTYTYRCACGVQTDALRKICDRDVTPVCAKCNAGMPRQVTLPAKAQFRGRVVQGGGPDRFTADVLGVQVRDLPAGLRST